MNTQSPINFRKNNCEFIPKRKKLQNTLKRSFAGYHSGIKSFQGFFFTLLIGIIFVFLNACDNAEKVALETDTSINYVVNRKKGEKAVWALTDQSKLTKVAMEAVSGDIRVFAVKRLTDQSALVKIALDPGKSLVGRAAVEKVINPSQIEKIALESKNESTRAAAIMKLTDPALLAKIALESKNKQVREASVEKLIEPEMMDSLSKVTGDRNAQLFYKLSLAFDKVPQERRSRHIQRILPAIIVLNNSEVMEICGKIISFRIGWSPMSAYYLGGRGKSGTMDGESVQYEIKLMKLSKPLYQSWSTKFSRTTSRFYFEYAFIDLGDILEPVLAQLSSSILEKIIMEDINYQVTEAAQKALDGLHNIRK